MNSNVLKKEVYDSITIGVNTPDGKMFVAIIEDEGKPVGINIYIGKAGAAIAAWAEGMSNMATLAMSNGASINDLISELSNQTSSKAVKDRRSQNNIRSGLEGVVYALLKYRRERYKQLIADIGPHDFTDVDEGKQRVARLGSIEIYDRDRR